MAQRFRFAPAIAGAVWLCLSPGGACAAEQTPVDPPSDAARLLDLAETWFDAVLEAHPFFATEIGDPRYDDRFDLSIRDDVRARLRRDTRHCLAELRRIDPAGLDDAARLNHDVLAWQLVSTLDELSFDGHLLPVSSGFDSPPFLLANMAGRDGIQPFHTLRDHDNYLARISGFTEWVEIALGNMRRGVERGVVPPRPLMQEVLERLDALIVDDPRNSPLYAPARRLPRTFSSAERDRLARSFRAAIAEQALPAYRRLRDFVRDEYLPHCRDGLSWLDLPDGRAWYAHLVRRHTTTDLTAEAVLEIGMTEVRRLVGELGRVAEELGYGDDIGGLLEATYSDSRRTIADRRAVLREYEAIQRKVEKGLPRLFGRLPEQRLKLHLVDPDEAAYTQGGSYVPPGGDGRRPGVFYVAISGSGSYPRALMDWLFLHEAIPGHHFQFSVAQSLEGLPRFRRFGHASAYVEGWALYAESLGHDLGLYADRYREVAALASELLRSARLVLDTGIHQGRWTESQAAEVARSQALGFGRMELRRYAAMPAQALSYKIGQLRILALRARAQSVLGPSFDLGEFHDAVLGQGPLPLDLLERQLEQWIQRKAAPESAPRSVSPLSTPRRR